MATLRGDHDALEHHWSLSIRGGKWQSPFSCKARINIILLEHPEIIDGWGRFSGNECLPLVAKFGQESANMTHIGVEFKCHLLVG